MIPGRVEGSGGPAEMPVPRLSHMAKLQFVHGCHSLFHKGQSCREVLHFEGRQVCGLGVCLRNQTLLNAKLAIGDLLLGSGLESILSQLGIDFNRQNVGVRDLQRVPVHVTNPNCWKWDGHIQSILLIDDPLRSSLCSMIVVSRLATDCVTGTPSPPDGATVVDICWRKAD